MKLISCHYQASIYLCGSFTTFLISLEMRRRKKRTFVQYLKRKRKKRNTKGILKIVKEANKNVKKI